MNVNARLLLITPLLLHLVEVAVDLRACLVDGLDRRPAELKLPPGL